MNVGQMFGKYPAVVSSYDRAARLCRVEIPGITDGADIFPEADFEYPIGDKSEHTEIRILVGDRVWVEFEAGDPRYPIITGFRQKRTGNEVGTRRWHHENIETVADQTQKHTAGTRIEFRVGNSSVVLTPNAVTVNTPHFVVNSAESDFNGEVDVSGSIDAAGDVNAGPISLRNHRTSLVQAGSGTGGPPVP